ncbi:MAG: amidohydrolase family protein [Acidobacteria bacterium]|nr:amidohydrolase family protein [Acidobacteriota bacterium]
MLVINRFWRGVLPARRRMRIAALCFGLLWVGYVGLARADDADLIVFNGKIATVDGKNAMVEAMAIKNDLVMALGKNEDMLKLAGSQTKKLDVKGRTVLPGIVDPHWHLANFMPEDFPEAAGIAVPLSKDRNEVKRGIESAINKKVKEAKPGEWILVYPMGDEARKLILFEEITRADLDRLAPNHPVMLNEVGTGPNSQVLLNSKGREVVERDFPGLKRFSDRDIKGLGTDLTQVVIKDVVLKGRDEDYARSLKRYLIENVPPSGITSTGSRIVRTPLNAFAILDRKGELPVRFGWFYGESAYFDPPGFYKRFPNLAGNGSKYFYNIGVGEELTDSPATGLCTTAPIKNPELEERFKKAHIDPCFLDNPEMRATVKDQLQYGRPVEYHNGGDKSIDILLEIIDEIRRETGMTVEQIREKRITMEHLLMVRQDQIPRLKEYGIIMTAANFHMTNQLDPLWPSNIRQNYGVEYVKWHQPLKSLLDGGVHTVIAEVMGSPFSAIQTFVTRETCFTPRLPGQGEMGVENCVVIGPEQKIDRVSALKMLTIWSAYYLFKEKEVGSLEPGKFADFAVLNKDYFTVPDKEIGNIKVLLTVLGGKAVYASPDFGSVDKTLFKSPEYFGKAALAPLQ